MTPKIEAKDSFDIVGFQGIFKTEDAVKELPSLWEVFGYNQFAMSIKPEYGVRIKTDIRPGASYYLIAEAVEHSEALPPEGLTKKTIPAMTWAIFTYQGPFFETVAKGLADIHDNWLPAQADYTISEDYTVEKFDNPSNYEDGMKDNAFSCEIWVPVIKK